MKGGVGGIEGGRGMRVKGRVGGIEERTRVKGGVGGIEGGRGTRMKGRVGRIEERTRVKGGLREGEGSVSIPPPKQSLVPWPKKRLCIASKLLEPG